MRSETIPLNWNDEEISPKVYKTTYILGLKEIVGFKQLIYHPFRFTNYNCSYNGIFEFVPFYEVIRKAL